MSFTPKTWQKEPITRPDLDRIEQGVADAHTTADDASARVRSVQRQYGTNPTMAGFVRDSEAYQEDGTRVPPGVPRYWTVAGGKAIRVDESDANLLTANQSSWETDLTGVSSESAVASRNTSLAYHGSASLQVSPTAANTNQFVTLVSVAVTPGLVYSAAAHVRSSASGQYALVLTWLDSGGAQIGGEDTAGMTAITAGSWLRVKRENRTAPAGAVSMQLRFYVNMPTTTDYCVFDALEVVQRAYVLSWHIGGATRTAEQLTVPTTGLSSTQGCWRQWVYVDAVAKRQVANQYNRVFQIPPASGDMGGGIQVFHSPTSANWIFGAGTGANATISDAVTPDGWHLFSAAWRSDRADLWIDGILRATLSFPTLPSSLNAVAYVGVDYYSTGYLNTGHGQVQLSTNYPTDADSLAAYQAGVNGLTWDSNTLALYDWTDTLWSSPRVGEREIWHEGNVGGDAPGSAVRLVGALLHEVDNRTVHYTYTSGRVSKVEIRSAGVVIWTQNVTYDGSGRVQTVAVSAKGKTKTVQYSYNADGTVATETHTTT